MLEIERKFLYNSSLNDAVLLEADCCLLIIQWYLSSPDARRIRLIVDRETARLIATVKSGHGMVRVEIESEMDIKLLSALRNKLKSERAIIKTRYVYKRDILEGVIDYYFMPAIGYVIEIETSDSFVSLPDPWRFWKLEEKHFDEVTDRPGYTARDLSVRLDSIDNHLPESIFRITKSQFSRFLKLTSVVYNFDD